MPKHAREAASGRFSVYQSMHGRYPVYKFDASGLSGDYINDLADIHGVHIAILIPLILDIRVNKGVLGNRNRSHFSAKQIGRAHV